ncbi:MAG: hypothetical protein LKCHEGNO_02889 [Burkholderiaceae bacterium]|nr:hypothetical protein [Burkholderiaceae bacterium]
MSEPADLPLVESIAGWRVGDRIWDEWNGTQVIHALRDGGPGDPPLALVEARESPGEQRWMALSDLCEKLAAPAPDRPSAEVPTPRVGQVLGHPEWGAGLVLELTVTDSGLPAARVEFRRHSECALSRFAKVSCAARVGIRSVGAWGWIRMTCEARAATPPNLAPRCR